MNRCITCAKIVSRPKAQNIIQYEGHEYLVCCPLCEKEFNRDPEHYLAIARAAMGDYALKAHTQTGGIHPNRERDASAELPADPSVWLLSNLQESFHGIQNRYRELMGHYEKIVRTAREGDDPASLSEHGKMMDSLENEMSIHAGVCQFVQAVIENEPRRQKPVSALRYRAETARGRKRSPRGHLKKDRLFPQKIQGLSRRGICNYLPGTEIRSPGV